MAVVNATPDSFSDGGRFLDPAAAIAQGRRLVDDGADLVDIGGESTRPGATPVAEDEEWRRVGPVIAGLAGAGAILSIDTSKPGIMARALDAGCAVVNDVFALTRGGLDLVARHGAYVVLSHFKGAPATMNDTPAYADVVAEVAEFLALRRDACLAAGIAREKILLDPGLGFGKTRRHNLALLHGLAAVTALGQPVVVGASRKFAPPAAAPEARLATSIAAALVAARQGAAILRVHDVAATRAALAVARPEPSTAQVRLPSPSGEGGAKRRVRGRAAR
jgi:dihydropteroate synthase